MTTREEKAVRFFTSGDNCAQSVLKAYCDLVGLTEEQAALVSVAFGGGIGRMRGNCGAFSAAAEKERQDMPIAAASNKAVIFFG